MQQVMVCTSTYAYVLVCTGLCLMDHITYLYVRVCTQYVLDYVMQNRDFVFHNVTKQWYINLLCRTVQMRMKIFSPVMRIKIFFGARPDAEDMEEAISKFLDDLEANECRGF
jgi:hypothetical protein